MDFNVEKTMGKQRLVDKSIQPMSTIQSITPANFTIARQTPAYGAVLIGDYKGAARFLDLDKLVVQPLALAEQLHILGILDGREEDYDIQSILVPTTAVPAVSLSAGLTVPTGEVWYLNAVQMNCAGDASAGFTMNWHCSLWTDRVITPSAHGQPFRTDAAALALATTHTAPAGGAIVNTDEFGEIVIAFAVTNKIPLLRLPAGTIITFTVLPDTLAPAVATLCTLSVFGFVGKVLVP